MNQKQRIMPHVTGRGFQPLLFLCICLGCEGADNTTMHKQVDDPMDIKSNAPVLPSEWSETEVIEDLSSQETHSEATAAESKITAQRMVMIHADDAGLCDSVNRATIEALEKGIVSSVSIMVPCPKFEAFAEYASAHPEHDYGIHLTLNSEFGSYRWGPVSDPAVVPSLIDKDGFLWKDVELVAGNAVTQQVEVELRSQIDMALQRGISLSHIDTHMGALWMRPDLAELYINLGIEYGLAVLYFSDNGGFDFIKVHPQVEDQAAELTEGLRSRRMPILDHGFVHYVKEPHEQRKTAYLEALRNLKPGITGIYIHCGYDDDELRSITSSSSIREGDRRVFTDPEVITVIRRLGLHLTNWKELSQRLQKPSIEPHATRSARPKPTALPSSNDMPDFIISSLPSGVNVSFRIKSV